ncbi:MAG: response regulator [Gelidibacter sp.]
MKTINTICIIDDDPIFRFGTRKMMETVQLSLDFLIYKNGKEAFDDLLPKLRQDTNLPDVILLDLNMPIMDGWQFLDELIKIPNAERIPIYIVSSSVDSRDIDKAKTYEIVNNYIIKPFSVSKIQELMEELSKTN